MSGLRTRSESGGSNRPSETRSPDRPARGNALQRLRDRGASVMQ